MNGNVSFWYADLGLPEKRAALPGDREADICIIGAGYTGLWTAYYLKKPILRSPSSLSSGSSPASAGRDAMAAGFPAGSTGRGRSI